jgi:hypothetical protein
MASDRRPRAFRMVVLLAVALSALTIGSTPVRAALAWWSPAGLRGVAVTRVSAVGDTIMVRTGAGATLTSPDAGKTFTPAGGNPTFPPTGTVVVGNEVWSIDSDGVVRHAAAGGTSVPDPQDLFQGAPRITSLAAFTQPLSDAIYLGTDGYGVLISTDGGDDWIRAGAGLPDAVFSLSADSARHALDAGTSDGLWVHVLQQFPAPPAYRDAALVWRWLGIGAITLVAAALTLLGMYRLVPRID